jgi:hypothetical protein
MVDTVGSGFKDVKLRFWILGEDGRTPVVASFEEQLRWMVSVNGISVQVALDEVGETAVSTAFISNSADERMSLRRWHFETLARSPDGDNVVNRYLTWEEAEAGHADFLASLSPPPALN